MKKIVCLSLAVLLLFTTLTACGNKTTTLKGPITVGSKIDTEGTLLAQMIIQMLQANGFQVVDKSGTGPTQIVRQALLSGAIDIYPEYTGNGAVFFPNEDPSVWKSATDGYNTIKQLDKQTNNIDWLQAAPENNTWAIAVTKTLADQNNLKTLSDLAAYINNNGVIKLAGSEEFITSAVALPAFEKAYGFTLSQSQLVTLQSGDTAQTEKYAAEGTDGVNAAMAYGTDGGISALNLVVLDDPKGVQPVYEPAPTIRDAVLTKYPEIANILNPVFASLTLTTLQSLNAQIQVNGQAANTTAHNYLVSKGFLK